MTSVADRFRRLFVVFTTAAGVCSGMLQVGHAQIMPDELAPTFYKQVRPALAPPIEEQLLYAGLAYKSLQGSGLVSGSEYIVLVDRSASVQAIFIFWLEQGQPTIFIGASPVSTGRVGQFDHFETPTGVFEHSVDNPDFRAEGTKNALGIRGYGVKGMRVFDFGWQQATRGWGGGGLGTMRLQMHATDPDLLEAKLGTQQSKGCIRISASLNHWLDTFGIIEADYADAVNKGMHLPVAMPTPKVYGSGRFLIVIDSGRSTRPEWATPQFSPRNILNSSSNLLYFDNFR
ncbi:L,D-transpeptidase family protein [Herminiimonas contaminans]|uniref:Murein L,D-transpeptidase n=1 Tax=Herminiimonas contaminans TaxID=1111140 RepID=A0ABS0EU37_9BURK|nr:murein L,D-transpeptidase [Herminiimonas contaminans]MBF8178362.1 murein L,D-transpeptidase [Herminiimonas contaminans]